MGISIRPLLASFVDQRIHSDAIQQILKKAEEEIEVLEDLQRELQTEHAAGRSLNWEDHPNRALLDRAYELDLLEFDQITYDFSQRNKRLSLIEQLEKAGRDRLSSIDKHRNNAAKYSTELQRFYEQLLAIIQKLSEISSRILQNAH